MEFKKTRTTSKGAVSFSRGISSMGRIFEERGDPLVTFREGVKDYGRNLLTEDPDRDRYLVAAKALFKPKYVDPPSKERKADAASRLANIGRRMNRELGKNKVNK